MSGTRRSAAPSSIARTARELLESDLASLPGLATTVDASILDRLELYVALLLEANERVNLTRVTDAAGIARSHLLDALVVLPILDDLAPEVAVDLGSGGGVPGIPVAIARPAVRWLLVDSVTKKARELAGFVERLGLNHVEVAAERAEILGRDQRWRGLADVVTARACAPLPALVELAMPLMRVGGTLLAWKGPLNAEDDELRRGRTALGEVGGGPFRLAPTGAPQLGGHQLVIASKVRATPDRYPRRVGEPQRRPLG
jgi:16S rRNA (guanine527-N7)-methyltransferase